MNVGIRMDLIFHPRAVRDAREIEQQYAGISEDLAQRFWNELNEELDEISSRPAQHFDPSGYRRRNLKRFPFHILFEERHCYLRVMIIRHHYRSSSYGMRRK